MAYLGSAQDDGLRLKEFQDYHFTYPDIGTTLAALPGAARGLRLAVSPAWSRSIGWPRPLADALAHLLDVPQRYRRRCPARRSAAAGSGDRARGRAAEAGDRAHPRPAITFCLGLNWLRHSKLLPDVTGVIARGACSVPWEPELRRLRSDGARPEQIAACLRRAAEQIVAAVRDTPPDSNLARQVALLLPPPPAALRRASLSPPRLWCSGPRKPSKSPVSIWKTGLLFAQLHVLPIFTHPIIIRTYIRSCH